MIDGLLNAIFRFLSYIPMPIGRFMGRMLGTLFVFLPLRRIKVSLDNIHQAFGSSMGLKGARRLNRKVILHFAQMLFEVPHISNMDGRNLEKYVKFVREENLREALREGKGAFILTGHFGNWEIISTALSLRFGALSIVARPLDFRPLDRIMNGLRTRFGAEIIPKQRGMRRIIQAIKRKRMVGILLDQNVDWYEGVFVDFFKRRACTNKGLALLALRTGTPVIPVFSVRHGDGRYHIVFEDRIRLTETGDKTRDIEENTALFTKVIEDYIRRYPDQWFWFHMRWKTRPYCTLSPDI